ncbi:hypothetical protein PAXRUDRAFT_172409 [Paxillus rubicundulus Ve08.2h10]|uniref:Unplaced genomic scaffold scaffold_3188, whole genome shotgun sequence n=1 Tax=Paxillus rubicundulus Ve08.2h10 TaxID=930991 RepID=A0A0D0CK45_9AGAM|nr:hypothetical protein PAXRUDRAFT_172409 [Paxillus rubicundulus Ve08.2h10]
MAKEKEAQKATATLQAATDEILQKKMARAEEEQRKAEETKTKGTRSQAKKQGEKQVEKWRRGAEAEESEAVKEDSARTASQASKRLKRTLSEEDGRHRTDEDEGNDPNLLDAFYHPPCNNCARQGIMYRACKYNNKKWSSCMLCRTKKIGCSILGASPEVKTAKGKVLQSKDALQEQGMRAKPATKSKRPERSKSHSGCQIARPGVATAEDVEMHLPKGQMAVKAKTKAKQTSPSPDNMNEDMPSGEEPEALRDPSVTQPKGHKVTKAKGKGKVRQPSPNAMDEDSSSEESEPLGEVFIPWVDKGKVKVDVVEHHTTILVDQLTKQLADMRSWETASNEMDQMADAEDLEWDRRLANMDELLRESHARHVALKAHLAESEQERMAMTAESAQARVMITNLWSMYTGMSQFLQFNSTVGGPGGIPPSALGGQAGPSQ